MEKIIRVYLADDHQIIIDGLSLLLKSEQDIVIVGESNNGDKAFDDILQLKPDIALIDLRMPGKDGLQLVKLLRHKSTAQCIILSMHDDKRFITDAANCGAGGYLLKNSGKGELTSAIRKVAAGEKVFPAVQTEEKNEGAVFLTPREKDILRLILNELSSQEIAEQLSLSTHTVDTHRKNIYKKTGSKNIVSLTKFAIDNNI